MTERHFRVVQLANKKVEIGGVSITSKASPGSAARKLLTSIAHEKGLKKNKKVNMGKVTFSIQEYTQGSSKKVYGPYVGHFHKYTATELKKAKTAGGKVKFTMKPVVKLAEKNMKGGDRICQGNSLHKKIMNLNSNHFNSTYSNLDPLFQNTIIQFIGEQLIPAGKLNDSKGYINYKVNLDGYDKKIYRVGKSNTCVLDFIDKFSNTFCNNGINMLFVKV